MSADTHASPERFSLTAFASGLHQESITVIVFFALAFLGNGLPRIFTNTVATTLFLEVFGSEMLPYTYIATAIAIPVIGYLFLRMEALLPFGRLLLLTMVVDLAVLLALWAGLAQGAPRWLVMTAMVWVEVEWVLVGLVFWGMAERIFDIRQAKRLFGVIGAGEAVAVVLGGLLMPALVGMFGIADLLLFSIAGVGTGCAIVYGVTTRYREQVDAEDEDDEGESAGDDEAGAQAGALRGPFEVLRNRYVLLLFGLSGLSMFTYFCIDNAFFNLVETRYPDEVGLASFLGLFGAWTGGLKLLCASLLYGWLMKRHGIAFGLMSLPVLLLAGTVLLLAAGIGVGSAALVFYVACFVKLNDEGLRDGIDATVFRLLYQPLRPQQRIRAETVEESFLEPLAGGAAGLLLLLLINGLGFRAMELFGCVVVLLAIWLLAVGPVYRAYLRVLAQAIRKRTFGAGSLNIDDDSIRAIVMAGLEDENASKVIYSLHLLQNSGYEPMEPILSRLLAHPAAEVRKEVLIRIEALRPPALAAAVRERLDREANPELRGAALIALAAMHEASGSEAAGEPDADGRGGVGQPGTIELLMDHLDDAAIETRGGALVGLMLHGGIEGIVAAGESFLSMVHSDDPGVRVAAAGILENLANRQFSRSLIPLLNDEAVAVRRRALHAAATMGAPQLYPLLGQMLAVPTVRGGAAMALVAGGELAVPYVGGLLRVGDADLDVRRQALDVLGRIGGAAATGVLVDCLPDLPESLRYHRLLALERSGYHAAGNSRDAVLQCIADDARTARTIVEWVALAKRGERTDVVYDALVYELLKYRHRIFLYLGFLHGQRTVRQAWQQYAEGSPERRAYALELVDNLLARPMREPVLAVLESTRSTTHGAGDNDAGDLETAHVLARIASGEPAWAGEWLRAASVFCLGRVGTGRAGTDGEIEAAILASIEHGPRLVRESGLRALVELGPVDLRERLEGFALDPSCELAAVARAILDTEGGQASCC